MKNYHVEAKAIHELSVSLDNIAHDDDKEIAEYTQSEIVAEAEYVLSTFSEPGHMNHEELHDSDPEIRKSMRKQLNELRKFVKKYKA